MKRDIYTNKFNSSFLSFEKDIETILRKLFIESHPYSDILKKFKNASNKRKIKTNVISKVKTGRLYKA